MDPQQQFCLKWNSFGNNLVSTFENLFKSASLTDVTLFCEGVTFQAHKLILAACSKHFQDLFESAPVCPSILVILDGTSSSNMSALLEFMYKGEVHVAQESLSSFLKAAEYLQVKGLSVEQEKLVTQTPSVNDVHLDVQQNSNRKHKQFAPNICGIKVEDSSANSRSQHISDSEAMLPPSSNTSSSPYHYPYKGQFYEQRAAASNQHPTAYDVIPRKRHQRSPSDSNTMTRASVLRDGSKKERESPLSACCTPPITSSVMGHHFEPTSSSLSLSSMPNEASNTPYGTAAVEKSPSPQTWHSSGTNCAEDLRMKCASVESGGSSSLDENGCDNRKFYSTPTVESSGDNPDRISQQSHMDLIVSSPSASSNAPTWNSTMSATPHKITTTTTPDGKKLQCPFCERLYGYETNLRAHIRQRHQGIRVPCPFCTRTFTRNNTVRRHIAREHKTELSLKALQQSQVQNHSQQPQ